MNRNTSQPQSSYRWIIVLLMGLTAFMANATQYQVAALAYQIIPIYQLTTAQFSSILNAPMLCAVFLSVPGGTLADRFGVKRVVAAGIIISTLAMYFRVYAHNYWELFISMLFLGVSLSLLGANVSKMLGIWFPQKQLGTAIGIYFLLCMSGNTAGLVVTTFFPSIGSAFLTFANVMLVLGILWIVFAKNKPNNTPAPPVMPVMKYIQVAAKSKNVWMAGVAAMLYMGGIVTFMGFLPTAFNASKGMNPAASSILTSVLTFGTMLGSILGNILCDRFGVIKPVLIFLGIAGAISLYCAWIVPVGVLTWVLLMIAGVLTGGVLPILLSFPMRLPEIGQVYAGSAGGIISTVQLLGAFFLPTFVIGTIAGNNYNLMFILGSLFVFLAVPIVAFFLPEVGLKAQAASKTGIVSTSGS